MIVTIEKLIFGGQGLARKDGQVIFVWGGLPGEEVEIEVLKKKKNFVEGTVTRVIKPSPFRVNARDDHFDSCSPWQVMTLEEENRWKKEIALETYKRNGNIEIGDREIGDIKTDEHEYEYRNKMEYNFVFDEQNKPSLAFHKRGTHRLRPVEKCALSEPALQEASERIIEWLRKETIPFGTLKSLIVRSDTRGKAVAALFVKQPFLPAQEYPIDSSLVGFEMYLSDYRSPASVPTELLARAGNPILENTINGVQLQCGLLSFFQINPPVFELALQDIAPHLGQGRVIDYYSGVGAISLALHGSYSEAVLIEENVEASTFAKKNVELNGFTNITVVNSLAEKAEADIRATDTVIVDPPRTGLHPDMVKTLLDKQPHKIIYVSCGLDTQARDIGLLKQAYTPVFWKLYNFFPHTPHIEGLCVLEKR